MNTGARRAEGRARVVPTGLELVGILLDLALLVILTSLVLELVGITSLTAVLANATIVGLVIASLALVGSLVIDNVKASRTGAHSAKRKDSEPPPVTRDILSEALAAIDASEHKFRVEHPDIVMAPPVPKVMARSAVVDDYSDLPDFAKPVGPAVP